MDDAIEAVCEGECMKFKIKKELKLVVKYYFVSKNQHFMYKLYLIMKKALI